MRDFDDFDGFGDFDEFDEFRRFDREKINRLFRQRMEDDEFRKRFFGIVGGYQRDFERIMKMLYGQNQKTFNPYSGLSFNPEKDSFFKGFDLSAFNEDGWKTEHWESPDGSASVTSFSRSMEWPPKGESDINNIFGNSPFDRGQKLPDGYVIKMLENKLKTAISEENYEEAANIRDAIKALKEENKDRKNDNSQKN